LTIPLLAVQRDDSGAVIVLLLDRQDRIQRRKVDLGIEGSRLAEVKSGLQQGDRVVLGNAAHLKDGEQITPRMEPQPANDVMREEGGVTDPQADEGGN
jgi:hypothetical protein